MFALGNWYKSKLPPSYLRVTTSLSKCFTTETKSINSLFTFNYVLCKWARNLEGEFFGPEHESKQHSCKQSIRKELMQIVKISVLYLFLSLNLSITVSDIGEIIMKDSFLIMLFYFSGNNVMSFNILSSGIVLICFTFTG